MSKCLKYELKENKTVFITIVLLLSLLCLFLKLCKKKKLAQQVHVIIFQNISFLDKNVCTVKRMVKTLKLLRNVKLAVRIYVW